jgi:hypothetical protein
MPPLITTFLNQQSNAVTHTRPSIALGVIAIKGQQPTDEVYLIGGQPPSGRVSGTTTDESPVLAGVNVFGVNTTLYLAWKVAGKNTIEVMQVLLEMQTRRPTPVTLVDANGSSALLIWIRKVT